MVTGSTGLLGSKMQTISEHVCQSGSQIDITTPDIITHIENENPDTVIHCAAFTQVDLCETERAQAWNTNVKGTENVAQACQSINAKMVYISTDYVFDGKKGMYTEDDTPNPLNWYGKTKLEGEYEVKTICDNWVIARTSVLYGWHKKANFVTWVTDQLLSHSTIRIVNDQYSCPTFADNLAAILMKMGEKNISGLYHVAGSERINRYQFALNIAETFHLDTHLITPVASEDLNQKAQRPKDSSLSIEKVKTVLDCELLSTPKGLQKMKEQCTLDCNEDAGKNQLKN